MSDAWLVVLNGKGDILPLDTDQLRIGRNPDNDLVLPGTTVSRVHALLSQVNGTWRLEDVQSTAGTYVNGLTVRNDVLHDGDVVEIGPHRFRFETAGKGRGRQIRLAQNLYKKAGRLAAAAELDEALVHYEKCVVLDPANPAFRVELGKTYERNGAWLRARECFQEALELDRECADARAGISRIDERIRIYEKQGSLVLTKNRRIDSVRDAGEWVTLGSEHFEIRFHIGHEQTRERQIYGALERAYRRVGEHLGFYPNKARVEILASREEAVARAEQEGIPLEPWMAGFYDGKVLCILITDDTLPDPHFPLISVMHEYTHLVCDQLTSGRCPAWLSEGLALLESQNLPGTAQARLEKAVLADALIPLELLESTFAALRYEELINLAYAQSFSVAEFLVKKLGWKGMRQLLLTIERSEGISGAFESLHWTYGALEAEWQGTLRLAQGAAEPEGFQP